MYSVGKAKSEMKDRFKIHRIIVRALLASCVALSGASSQTLDPRGPSTVVIYGDTSRDWLADVLRFSELLDPRDRPIITAGDGFASIPADATLVWFGDLAHNDVETVEIPSILRSAINDLGQDVTDKSEGLAEDEVRIGANCYTYHFDRPDGLPAIAVNFSGEDPQSFCKGLTIADVLGNHGRWMRNDGTGCLLRNCEMILPRPSTK